MFSYVIETFLANADFGGVDNASQQEAEARKPERVFESLNMLLEEEGQPELTAEEKAAIEIVDCDFIEADSNRLHGTCYFSVELYLPASLRARLPDQEVAGAYDLSTNQPGAAKCPSSLTPAKPASLAPLPPPPLTRPTRLAPLPSTSRSKRSAPSSWPTQPPKLPTKPTGATPATWPTSPPACKTPSANKEPTMTFSTWIKAQFIALWGTTFRSKS